MIKVVFKNLEKSELARQAVIERIAPLADKFPGLKKSHIHVTLEMHNSPHQAGPDLFTVKSQIRAGKYKGIRLKKSASSLYRALADLVNNKLERLNRSGDKKRVKKRNMERKFRREAKRQFAA